MCCLARLVLKSEVLATKKVRVYKMAFSRKPPMLISRARNSSRTRSQVTPPFVDCFRCSQKESPGEVSRPPHHREEQHASIHACMHACMHACIHTHRHRLHSSSFLGIPARILKMNPKRNYHGAHGYIHTYVDPHMHIWELLKIGDPNIVHK